MLSLFLETMLFIIISFLIYFFEPQSSEWLAYYHTGIKELQFWRVITATFCHTNFNHLTMNLIGLIVILGLFIDYFKKAPITPLIIFSSIFIASVLFTLQPEVIWYVGFSGVLHALFSYGVVCDIQQKSRWGLILGLGLISKIAFEQHFGAQQSTIELIDAPVLINAHLYGAISGVIFYYLNRVFKQSLN